MKRALADICVFALLFGLLQLLSFVEALAFKWDIYLLLAVPFFAGFVRGVLEGQFLKQIPFWIASLECGLVVFASDIILCALGSTGKAPDNFWTIFGAFFIIFIVPSISLSIGGFIAAVTLQTDKKSPW
jgi:hypothetical protein